MDNQKLIESQCIYGKDILEKRLQSDNTAHIVLCCDKNVMLGLGVTMFSFIQHMTLPCCFHIFFNGEMPMEEDKRLAALSEKHNVPICIYHFYESLFSNLKSSNQHITVTTYYRFLVPYVLQQLKITRFLYVDTDILCIEDVSDLFLRNLNNTIAFVSKDELATTGGREEYCAEIGMRGRKYFNAGMLFIDVEQYVAHNIGWKALELATKTTYPYMDQDVLNILLEGNVVFDSSYAYNCLVSIQSDMIPQIIKIVHFVAKDKPWKLYTTYLGNKKTKQEEGACSWKYAYYEQWRNMKEQSPWKDYSYTLPKDYHEWRYLSNMYRQNGEYMKALKAYYQYLKAKLNK